MHDFKFKLLDLNQIDKDNFERFEDRNIFQTGAWLKFIARTQSAMPIVVSIENRDSRIGYFTGLIFDRFGFRILGSPFKGWTTSYMGFNLTPEFDRRDILKVLPSFVFDELKCHYLEIVDRKIREDQCVQLNYHVKLEKGLEIDLTKSEEELFANMHKKSCRWCIRKSEKSGVFIEEAHDVNFAEDYYSQLIDVFNKQSLIPTYRINRVTELIRYLLPTGNLLLLRARNSSRVCIATGIFPAFNDTMFFWGGASWRKYQDLRPNELIVWHAMKYWKSRGIKKFDMCGWKDYKLKYGSYEIMIPRLMLGSHRYLYRLRNLAEKTVQFRQLFSGYIKNTLCNSSANQKIMEV